MAASKKAQRQDARNDTSTYEERAQKASGKSKLAPVPLDGLNLPDKDLDELCDENLSEAKQPEGEPGKAGG